MNEERDELDAFLDAGKARYGGVTLATALDEAAMWAESRAARRRRVARTWVAGGVVAGLLAGGTAVATAMVNDREPYAIDTSIALTYSSDSGAICVVEIQPVVPTADPSALLIARNYLAKVAPPALDLTILIEGGPAADREVEALINTLSLGVEDEIFRLRFSRVDVTLVSDYSCTAAPVAADEYGVTPPVAGDDFGRQPTLNPGRAPDVVGFFRASTGQICEIQMKVEVDWANGQPQTGAAVTARAFLAAVDFTTVDYSVALSEMEDYWPEERDLSEREASALSNTLIEQMFLTLDPTGRVTLPVMVEGWSYCDPEPSE